MSTSRLLHSAGQGASPLLAISRACRLAWRRRAPARGGSSWCDAPRARGTQPSPRSGLVVECLRLVLELYASSSALQYEKFEDQEGLSSRSLRSWLGTHPDLSRLQQCPVGSLPVQPGKCRTVVPATGSAAGALLSRQRSACFCLGTDQRALWQRRRTHPDVEQIKCACGRSASHSRFQDVSGAPSSKSGLVLICSLPYRLRCPALRRRRSASDGQRE